jgi:hypothetical protein
MLATEGILQYARNGGYSALHGRCISNHIMLWADFDFKAFLGGLGPKYTLPQEREFSIDTVEMRG